MLNSKFRLSLYILMCVVGTSLCIAGPAPEKTEDGVLLDRIFKDTQELSVAYLRPGQIKDRLSRAPVLYIPLGPIEWHGLHMPFGTDPLNAQTVALGVCRITGGVVWPTLFFGAASLRTPEQAKSIFALPGDQYVWSMDFPGNILKSGYCQADILALIVREAIREASAMGAKVKLIVLINGHGAGNHVAALERVASEVTADTGLRVYLRGAWQKEPLYPEKEGHACAAETSLMMSQTRSVDPGQLPPLPGRLKYAETAIVDDFNGRGKSNFTVPDETDPRRAAAAEYGLKITEGTVNEIAQEIRELLGKL